MSNECKKCLLYEAGEKVTSGEIEAYINTLPQDIKADNDTFLNRISFCKRSDYLISGMCRKCGCYVEVRARIKSNNCPDVNNRKW